MYKILERKQLADKIYYMVVNAPRVAKSCLPGQFVIVKMDEVGERIPLTICDYDREAGTVTIVFQVVGASTERMTALYEGDFFQDFVGPLGCPSELVEEDIEELKKKKIMFVAGGVGAAPVYPQVKWMHEHGIDVDVVVGAKNHEMLILEDEMKAVAGNLYVCTDDGSYGIPGMVTTAIEELAENSAVCVPTMMPYITAFFMPRTKGDRPDVIPDGCVNFAFLGQFAETPRDTVFTTEYSVRTAMEAVYGLLGVDRGVPEVWGSVYDIRELLDSSVKLMDGKSPLEIQLPGPLNALKKPVIKVVKGTVIEKLLRDHGILTEDM